VAVLGPFANQPSYILGWVRAGVFGSWACLGSARQQVQDTCTQPAAVEPLCRLASGVLPRPQLCWNVDAGQPWLPRSQHVHALHRQAGNHPQRHPSSPLPTCSKYYGATVEPIVTPLQALQASLPDARVTFNAQTSLTFTTEGARQDAAACEVGPWGCRLCFVWE